MNAAPFASPVSALPDGWQELIASGLALVEAGAPQGPASAGLLQTLRAKLNDLGEEYARSPDRRQRLLIRAEGCWLIGGACSEPCQRQTFEAMGQRYAALACARAAN